MPPLRRAVKPWRMALGWPLISRSTSGPWSCVSSRAFAGQASSLESNVTSAPSVLASSRRRGLTSVTRILPAPAAWAIVTAIRPMMPTPVISTLRPLTPAAMTVCIALPSGSKMAAM